MGGGQRTVVVTGASTGIGRASALALSGQGLRVFAGVRREEDARSLEEAGGGRLEAVRLDVAEPEEIAAAARRVDAEVGRDGLAGLVNNAGIAVSGPVEHLELDALRRQLEVNTVGQVAVTQAFLPLLRRARGRIVNVSSIGGRVANPLLGAYCASKFALEALSDALRLELRPWGLHVAVVEPGTIATPIFDKGNREADALLARMPEAARARYAPLVEPFRRVVDRRVASAIPPERVAQAVVHALTAPRPRIRYVVGRDARVQAVLARLLPDRVRDALVARFLGFPRSLP